jgi:hypothetical protein
MELWDHEGFKLSELNEIGGLVAHNLEAIFVKWGDIHG